MPFFAPKPPPPSPCPPARVAWLCALALLLATALGDARAQAARLAPLEAPCPVAQPVRLAEVGWASGQLFTELLRLLLEGAHGCATELQGGSTAATEAALIDQRIHLWAEQWGRSEAIQTAVQQGQVLLVGDVLQGGAWEGFFVPSYLVQGDPQRAMPARAPGLQSVADLKRHAALFIPGPPKASGAGLAARPRLLSCPVGWACEVVNTQKMRAYGLDELFQLQRPASPADMDAGLQDAMRRGEAVVFYHWWPSVLLAQGGVVRLREAEFDARCWATLTQAQTLEVCPSASPVTRLSIGVSSRWAATAGGLMPMLQKLRLSVDEMQALLRLMGEPSVTPQAAVRAWARGQAPLWSAWLTPAQAKRLRAHLQRLSDD